MRYLLVALTLLLLVPTAALADEEADKDDGGSGLSVTPELGLFTNFYWRGANLFEDSMALQPAVTVEPGFGLSLNVWSCFALQNREENEAVDQEVDTTLAWNGSVPGILEAGGGLVVYTMTGADPVEYTEEVFATAKIKILPFLDPSLTLWYNIDPDKKENRGLYATFALEYSIGLGPVEAGAKAFVSTDRREEADEARWPEFGGEVSASVELGPLTATAVALHNRNREDETDQTVFGAVVGYTF